MSLIITVLIYLIILAVVWWLGNYILDNLPLPAPVGQIGRVVLTVVLVLIGVWLLISLLGAIGGVSLSFPKLASLALV